MLLNKQIFPSPDLDNFDIILSKVNTSKICIAAFQEEGARKCLNCSLILIPMSLEGFHRIGKKLSQKKPKPQPNRSVSRIVF